MRERYLALDNLPDDNRRWLTWQPIPGGPDYWGVLSVALAVTELWVRRPPVIQTPCPDTDETGDLLFHRYVAEISEIADWDDRLRLRDGYLAWTDLPVLLRTWLAWTDRRGDTNWEVLATACALAETWRRQPMVEGLRDRAAAAEQQEQYGLARDFRKQMRDAVQAPIRIPARPVVAAGPKRAAVEPGKWAPPGLLRTTAAAPTKAAKPASRRKLTGEAADKQRRLVARVRELASHKLFHHPTLGRALATIRSELEQEGEGLATMPIDQLERLVGRFEEALGLKPGEPVPAKHRRQLPQQARKRDRRSRAGSSAA